MADTAFYSLDQDLKVVTASPFTMALWGKSADDVVGRPLTDIFPSVAGGCVHRALRQALKTLRPSRLRTHSTAYGCEVEVEIYPVQAGLQVRFGPVLAPRGETKPGDKSAGVVTARAFRR